MEEARECCRRGDEKHLALLKKLNPIINRVGVSYRSKAMIEPYMSKQWFVQNERLCQKLRAAVTEAEVATDP